MHLLLIGEGQIGQAAARRATEGGGTVTIVRRTEVSREESASRYGHLAGSITHMTADVLDVATWERHVPPCDAILACFHAPYDARVWEAVLPPRERAVLDVAALHDVPVVFPESLYAFQGDAPHVVEGTSPTPSDAKGRVRRLLLDQRREHGARTLSIVASDLIGPESVGTGASVAAATVIEPLTAGRRPFVVADPSVPHSFTAVGDLVEAMLLATRDARRLAGPTRDAVLHAPTNPPTTLRDLAAGTSRLLGERTRRPLSIPRGAVRAIAPFSTLARELAGIAPLWYGPCVMEPGLLTREEGMLPTPWEDVLGATVERARMLRHGRRHAPRQAA